MATERDKSEVDSTYIEPYYEEPASIEELYLEETEEELRSKLISDTPRDDRCAPALDTAFELYREEQADLFRK